MEKKINTKKDENKESELKDNIINHQAKSESKKSPDYYDLLL